MFLQKEEEGLARAAVAPQRPLPIWCLWEVEIREDKKETSSIFQMNASWVVYFFLLLFVHWMIEREWRHSLIIKLFPTILFECLTFQKTVFQTEGKNPLRERERQTFDLDRSELWALWGMETLKLSREILMGCLEREEGEGKKCVLLIVHKKDLKPFADEESSFSLPFYTAWRRSSHWSHLLLPLTTFHPKN